MREWSDIQVALFYIKTNYGLTNPDILELLKNKVKIYKDKILDNRKKLNY